MLEIPIKNLPYHLWPTSQQTSIKQINRILIQVIFDSTETYYKPMPVKMKAYDRKLPMYIHYSHITLLRVL